MERKRVKICSLKKAKKDISILEIESSYLAKKSSPGQFLHIRINKEGLLLRRPFSIHKVEKEKVYILFRVRGEGTKVLSQYKRGDFLDIIGPLGRGFDLQFTVYSLQFTVILVAGGIGVAPLLFLAQKLKEFKALKSKLLVFLGAKSRKEILCRQDFEDLGCKVLIATEDGSFGFKGKVTDLLVRKLSSIGHKLPIKMYACGPEGMFLELSKILKNYPNITCQISLEQFMGCGIGACRGCVIKTKQGFRRVCRDGPVFDIKEVF